MWHGLCMYEYDIPNTNAKRQAPMMDCCVALFAEWRRHVL